MINQLMNLKDTLTQFIKILLIDYKLKIEIYKKKQ